MSGPVERWPFPEPPPDWTRDYLSAAQQRKLAPALRWVLLLDHAPLQPATHHVALRVAVYAGSKPDGSCSASIRTVARSCHLARNTARGALRSLHDAGWLTQVDEPDGRRVLRLSWPAKPWEATP